MIKFYNKSCLTIPIIAALLFGACQGDPQSHSNSPNSTQTSRSQCPIAWMSKEVIKKESVSAQEINDFKLKLAAQTKTLVKDKKENKAFITEGLAGIFPPVERIIIDKKTYYISQSICDKRPIVILYSLYDSYWFAHLYYRSLSNGVWRSAKYYDGIFDKGIHYTQEMLPHVAIDEQLNDPKRGSCLVQTEQAKDNILWMFSITGSFDEILKETPAREIFHKDKNFENYKNGKGFIDDKEETRTKFFESMSKENLPTEFFPNFLCLNRSYVRAHSLFSEPVSAGQVPLENNVKVDVFLAMLDGKPIEWHFAYVEGTQEPWIARIRFADSETSVFGADSEIIQSGALTLKPVEYNHQIYGLKQSDYEPIKGTRYVDIRKFLQNFPPIIAYRKYKDEQKSW